MRELDFIRPVALALAVALVAMPAMAQTQKKPLSQTLPGPQDGPIHQGLRTIENAGQPQGSPDGRGTASSGDATALIAKPFQDIANFISNDNLGAAKLSVALPDLQDGTGLACWNAMRTAANVFQAHPVPVTFHAMTDFQGLRLIVMATNKLCDEPACTVVFADGTNIVQAAAPIALTGLPSLSQLCAKVAHIKVTAPTQADLDALKAAEAAANPSTAPATTPAAPTTTTPAPAAPATTPNP